MNYTQLLFKEIETRLFQMEEDVKRRREVLNYLKQQKEISDDELICAISWLNHTTKTADEIIEILEGGD